MQRELRRGRRLARTGWTDERDDVRAEATAPANGLLKNRCGRREPVTQLLDFGRARGDDFYPRMPTVPLQLAAHDDGVVAQHLTSLIEYATEVSSAERFKP